jgi:iron(III) transport system permease protein
LSARILERSLVALFLALLYGPLLAPAFDLASVPNLLSSARLLLLARSAALSASVALAATAVATLAALALQRRRATGWPLWLGVALAMVPSYIHSMAWGPLLATVRGWLASGVVEAFSLLPLAFCLALLALASVDSPLLDAARLHRPAVPVLLRILLPLAAPPLVASACLLFVLSLADYTVPSLFSTATYSLGIFAEFSAGNRPGSALLLALPLMALSLGLLLTVQRPLRHAALRGRSRPLPLAGSAPLWWRILELAALSLCLLDAGFVLYTLARAAGSPVTLWTSALAARSEIGAGFGVAAVSAVLALPLALVAGRRLARGSTWLWLLTLLPLAGPAPLVGIGLVGLWNRPVLGALYGTAAMPVLASLARFLPLAAMVAAAWARRLDPTLLDAGRLFQPNRTRGFFRVTLPLMARGLAAAAGVVFALALGELGATLIVAPPGMATLSMRIYNYLHYGASDTVAALCLVAALGAAAGALGLARWVPR